jgi:hypothetical protein
MSAHIDKEARWKAYLKRVYGNVIGDIHIPSHLRGVSALERQLVFYVDERGTVAHREIRKASGNSDLEAVAIKAVDDAIIPPPPSCSMRSILLTYAPN